MKNLLVAAAVLAVAIFVFSFAEKDQGDDPWTKEQLMAPAKLAELINNEKAIKPVIFNIGPSGAIKGSIEIGSTDDEENLGKLKKELAKLPKNKDIVIYCGCCPFDRCPNIRPAFNLLKEMGFVNGKLLNLPKNLKVNWIDKGYPIDE